MGVVRIATKNGVRWKAYVDIDGFHHYLGHFADRVKAEEKVEAILRRGNMRYEQVKKVFLSDWRLRHPDPRTFRQKLNARIIQCVSQLLGKLHPKKIASKFLQIVGRVSRSLRAIIVSKIGKHQQPGN